jgi:hypothetical protein
MNNLSQVWQKHGESVASDHGMWEFTARPLLRAARICWDKHAEAARSVNEGNLGNEVVEDLRLGGPAHMLAGMGLEATLKAIILRTQPELVATGSRTFYSHNLRAIAVMVPGVSWTEEELETLSKLGEFVEWSGRYPVPRWDNPKGKAKYDCPATVVDGQEVIKASDVPGSFGPTLWERVASLIEKVCTAYDRPKDRAMDEALDLTSD